MKLDNQLKQPKQQRSKETVQKILEVGQKEFATNGYHNTSTKKIARAAGISIGSFYTYFKDKKALLIELYRLHSEQIHEYVHQFFHEHQDSRHRLDSHELMNRFIKQVTKMHDFSPEFQKQMAALKFTDPDFEQILLESEAQSTQMIVHILKEQGISHLNDFEAAAIVISQSIEAVVHGLRMFESKIEQERLLNALSDMLHAYLYPKNE